MAIVLFTDFGSDGLYVGQMKAVLDQLAPGVPVIDLLNVAPAYNARASAHLLAALVPRFPQGSVFVAVVDPGVGGDRDALLIHADGYRLVGPDNGLLSVFAARAAHPEYFRVTWPPPVLSASFHGRDLFAPVAARVATGTLPPSHIEALKRLSVDFDAADLAEVIFIDRYGNALTGLRAQTCSPAQRVSVANRMLRHARVFSEAQDDEPFWYENSLGLVEIAVNSGSAASRLGLSIGDRVSLVA